MTEHKYTVIRIDTKAPELVLIIEVITCGSVPVFMEKDRVLIIFEGDLRNKLLYPGKEKQS